jgi:hypothetical protein
MLYCAAPACSREESTSMTPTLDTKQLLRRLIAEVWNAGDIDA